MEHWTCDVAIAGAGPAGVAAAITLARAGRSVVVVNRRRPGVRRFGESLAPAGVPLLTNLGLDAAAILQPHLRCSSMRSAWGDGQLRLTDLTFHPYGCAWHLDRAAYDQDLLQAAETSGARVISNTSVRHCARTLSGWQIDLSNACTVHASWIIDATGRGATVARRLGATYRRVSRLTALTAHTAAVPRRGQAQTLVEATSDGWWYAADMPGERMAVAFFTDPRSLPRRREDRAPWWEARLAATVHLRRQVPGPIAHHVGAAVADTGYLAPAAGERWTAIGDAAFAVDPLSSFGICNGLDMGMQAAGAIDAALGGELTRLADYQRYVTAQFEESDRWRMSYYAMERRFAQSPFWATRGGANGAGKGPNIR